MTVDSGELTVTAQTAESKSFFFAVRIVKLCKHLLRSGTSIGANISEAQQAQSRADFVFKLSIALKEAAETNYWLRLLHATDYLNETEFRSIHSDCCELERMLTAIIKSSKE